VISMTTDECFTKVKGGEVDVLMETKKVALRPENAHGGELKRNLKDRIGDGKHG